MLTIGAPLHKWTLCLLLCSLSTCGVAQSANETTAVESSPVPTPSASSTSSPSKYPAASSFADSACPFRTINYITHTLPQQCLRTDWAAPSQRASVEEGEVEATLTPESVAASVRDWIVEAGTEGKEQGTRPQETEAKETAEVETVIGTASIEAEAELETDSPLDNANFLSFEEWKNRNLAQAGQSPDNVGQGRATSNEQRGRRRPVNVNALDSLGEEGEIEIDFSGFGSPSKGGDAPSSAVANTQNRDEGALTAGGDKAAPSAWALSKDAGKTCKERFNFASFDCAATVVKTNPKAKSSTSILVENKDSYMLNECSADNKYIIVELCDDILVDTIVLANYEFFSSMFRHFRISVSDRYPVKMDRWRVLGTFEARNSRDIQPFLIKEPQIWARYLRVEFLTHYGNEYYCPMSLLRVHGTTMMEQFRREEEQARGDDADEPIEAVEGEPVQSAVQPVEDQNVPGVQVPVETDKNASGADADVHKDNTAKKTDDADDPGDASTTTAQPIPTEVSAQKATTASDLPSEMSGPAVPSNVQSRPTNATSSKSSKERSSETAPSPVAESSPQGGSSAPSHKPITKKTDIPRSVPTQGNDSKISTNASDSASSSGASAKAGSNSTSNGSQTSSPPQKPAQTQPNPAAPSTQESFFKSIHKRLQYLEANSTLSLQYIEEQSRILRDAFIKVEKKQLQKTEKFLDHLNSTVMHELKTYRNMYDQLWQSTILELEGIKERQKTEVGEIGARLSMMADELVWQKRMAVVQSTLLLLCLGLVLFVRSGTLGSQSDVPIAQQLGQKYSSFFDSPTHGSGNSRGVERQRWRTLRSTWRSDTSIALSDRSGHLSDANNAISDAETDDRRSPINISFDPATPLTPDVSSDIGKELGSSPPQMNGIHNGGVNDSGLLTPIEDADTQAKRLEALETQSGPATPRGSRDNRPSWEEVDRAVDLLKAGEKGKSVQSELEMDRQRRQRRSPLGRAESYGGTMVDSPVDDECAEGLFDSGTA
ncbi:hypothetical protein CC80DRAFT_494821 [Byssothecium circinans]|uniref:SUN domain-containing protein n=1 Tax=Byssothecium circinans TaxID=147558 RepID=A0A6A5TKM5_9PLEO|nr:hypothetical protein CC80DRAFT_494821 [Byssothecium circinans]